LLPHSCSGLTSKVVIVAGCLEGLIPFIDPDQPQDAQLATLQEQRRMFYVAITRATDILVLSSATQLQRNIAYRMGVRVRAGGMTVGTIASRFLAELNPSAPRATYGPTWVQNRFR
jgi:ATP-dependent DNA helicase Rep